jgi:hypothetical protein
LESSAVAGGGGAFAVAPDDSIGVMEGDGGGDEESDGAVVEVPSGGETG